MKWWNITALFLIMGAIPVHGYRKMCYLRPQYGREGSREDFHQVMSKYVARCTDSIRKYAVRSPDDRQICFIDLDDIDRARVKLALNAYDGSQKISYDMIRVLMNGKRGGMRITGSVLRDFKCRNENATIQEVRCALGIDKDNN